MANISISIASKNVVRGVYSEHDDVVQTDELSLALNGSVALPSSSFCDKADTPRKHVVTTDNHLRVCEIPFGRYVAHSVN